MTGLALLILVALAIQHGIRLLADLLHLKSTRRGLPEEFSDVYDAERYRVAQRYGRARTRLGIVGSAVHLAALLLFWWLGGFPWLDGIVRGFELGAVPSGLFFIGALVVAQALLSLPFRWFSTFVVEERFGFNRTTPRTFVLDGLKGALLGIALGGPLLALILWLFEAAGASAWLWCWAATTGFAVLVQFVAPTWIFPLFFRFEPLAPGDLRDAILAYARRVAFPLEGVFVIDGSRRSTKANAFFSGFGSRKRVALFDTLVERHTPDELVAVLAHEVGHYKEGHIPRSMALQVGRWGVVFFLMSLALERPEVFAAFLVEEPSTYVGLVLFAILFSPLDFALSPLERALSRRYEYEADAYAARTSSAESLIHGLKRLSAESLATLTPHPLYVWLHDAHPPLRDRIGALREPA